MNLDSDDGDLWDSGRVSDSDKQTNIIYEGAPLESRSNHASGKCGYGLP